MASEIRELLRIVTKENKGEKLETNQLKVKYAELKGTFTAEKELQKNARNKKLYYATDVRVR